MLRAESHTRKTLTIAVAAVAMAAPAAQAGQDLRSPDARDAAIPVVQDLRSPDARDAARVVRPSEPSFVRQDLRSPDARDAGQPVRHSIPQPAPVVVDDPSGFDWGDAGIGAGVIAALMLLLGLGAGGVHHRRRTAVIPS